MTDPITGQPISINELRQEVRILDSQIARLGAANAKPYVDRRARLQAAIDKRLNELKQSARSAR